MRLNIQRFTVAFIILFGLAACNFPGAGSGSPNTIATMESVATGQAATLQAIQTPNGTATLSSLPTLSFPTLPPLNTPVDTSAAPVPTSASAATAIPVSYCNWAAYVKDVTIPDGTIFKPGEQFTKTWRLRNIGTCAWTTSYALVFSSGNSMSGPIAAGLPTAVYPGETIDISVNLKSPAAEGTHRGYWGLRNASGVIFGIGRTANDAFYVDIKVEAEMTTIFDFAANYCAADWRSEAGDLGCPGNVGGKKGYAIHVNDPKLENGKTYRGMGILTVPQKVFNGYLKGFYQGFTVHDGDRLRGIINCEYASDGCNVLFRIEYKVDGEQPKTFWQYPEQHDKKYYAFDLDLSPLAGKKVKFILAVFADGSAEGDKPIWVAPRIDRPSNLITPVASTPTTQPSATVTLTPPATITPTITATP